MTDLRERIMEKLETWIIRCQLPKLHEIPSEDEEPQGAVPVWRRRPEGLIKIAQKFSKLLELQNGVMKKYSKLSIPEALEIASKDSQPWPALWTDTPES